MVKEFVDGVQEGDLPEHVDYQYLRRVAVVAAAAAGELALAPRPASDVVMDVSGLTPHTTLRWAPAKTGVEHAVLYRRTHEPDWTHRQVVGAASEITLEGVSKDDWIFAVETIGASGHRGLPVYPTPER